MKKVAMFVFLMIGMAACAAVASDVEGLEGKWLFPTPAALEFHEDGTVFLSPYLLEYAGLSVTGEATYVVDGDTIVITTPEGDIEAWYPKESVIVLKFPGGEKMMLQKGPEIEAFYSQPFFEDISTYSANRTKFAHCVESLTALKIAEEMHITDYGEYTENWDRLAVYMIAGCLKMNGLDCEGEVKKRVEKYCDSPTIELKGPYDYEIKGTAKDENGCRVTVVPDGYYPEEYDPEACGSAEGESAAESGSSGIDSIPGFAARMCEISKSADIEAAFEMIHPEMIASNAEMLGMDVNELKEMLKESAEKNFAEKCEVTFAEEEQCKYVNTKLAKKLGLKVDRCAEVRFLMKMSMMDHEQEDSSKLISIDGRWYVNIDQ